ncbi:ABC-type transport system substrate-binding protein [Streptosporangium becharense]|uniref:ABC-type transport system substrate-binding protein n=1 Tax=Streptosporangium becharense TaxID=1816182 RepID=A0A7W9MDS8_9ACTN|nr:ABC transporter substrate-binding protein [Streptosporangium becharense]MBB2914063.1 ABC-type transport system substrate-binding protein [Streptosporangium becharense]MBB5817090.1 ABC-type transport system substrate-binding protein [Streptosporangium becharense]
MVESPRWRARLRGAAAALALLGTATACGGGGGGGAGENAAGSDTVRIDLTTNARSIDPISGPLLVDNQIISLTSATLFAFKKGSATETSPVLVEKMTAAGDRRTYTIKLKPGLKFSDGTPLTGKDVVASLERVRDTPGPNAQEAKNLASVTAPEDDTVVIELKQADTYFDQQLAIPSYSIIPAAAAEAKDYFSSNPVFSGAYVPDGDPTSKKFALVRNENFGGPKPKVKRIEFSVISDPVTSATRLNGGEIDVAPMLSASSARQVSDGAVIKNVQRLASLYLIPNNRSGSLFSDVRLRQALAWAVDRAALAKVAYGDAAKVQSGPYPVPATYPVPVEVYPRQDVAKARELLKGTACENGCTVSASYFASSTEIEGRVAVALQQMLTPLGIEIKPTPVEDQQFISNSLDGSFELNIVESGSFNIAQSFIGAFDTSETKCIYAGCSNDKMEGYGQELLGAPQDGAAAASEKVLRTFEEWTPIVPVTGAVFSYGVREGLQDTVVLQPSSLFWIESE